MDKGFLKWDTTGSQLYNQSGFAKRAVNCNGFIAVNTGDDIVRINDQVLYPGVPGITIGDSVTYGGNFGELFIGQIKISFDGVGANPQVAINQKIYITNNNEQIF